MRKIKFRGKCERGCDYSDGDGWIYGSLLKKDNVCDIVKTEDIDLSHKTDDGYYFVEDLGCVPVIHKTVGQFTGLTDKNGTEIYEGDIVKHRFKRPWKTEYHESKVYWNQVWFCFYLFDGTSDYRMRDDIEYEVIGNIFESNNPELLNEKQ